MYIVKGYKKNSGTLDNGKKWSNYTLACLKDDENYNGFSVQSVKVPTKVLESAFGEPAEMLDKKIRVNYDIRTYNGSEKAVVTSIDIIK